MLANGIKEQLEEGYNTSKWKLGTAGRGLKQFFPGVKGMVGKLEKKVAYW